MRPVITPFVFHVINNFFLFLNIIWGPITSKVFSLLFIYPISYTEYTKLDINPNISIIFYAYIFSIQIDKNNYLIRSLHHKTS